MKFKHLEIDVSQAEAGRTPSSHKGPIVFDVASGTKPKDYPEYSFSLVPGFLVVTTSDKRWYFNSNNILSLRVIE